MAMTNEEKYLKWLEHASEDLTTAEVMLKNGRYSYVAFMCQQAIEKLAKGLFVYTFGKEAPFTHNINTIVKDIEPIVNDEQYQIFDSLFDQLTSCYIVGRYEVYKEQLARALEQTNCKDLLDRTKEAFAWLQSLKK